MEEKLIAEYIGKDAYKIMDEKVNWTAAIIGQAIVFLVYEKME